MVREVAVDAVAGVECARLRRYLGGIRGGGNHKKLRDSIEKLEFDIFSKSCDVNVGRCVSWIRVFPVFTMLPKRLAWLLLVPS